MASPCNVESERPHAPSGLKKGFSLKAEAEDAPVRRACTGTTRGAASTVQVDPELNKWNLHSGKPIGIERRAFKRCRKRGASML